jgi:hypothetical protein
LAAFVVFGVYQSSRVRTLRAAAGSASGDSYILCAALKKVVERHNSNVRIDVVETGGTVENLRMLETKTADIAVAQADVTPGPSAQSVAVLFDDTFQLLVHEASSIHNFADLRGKRIALARSGGQFDSFVRVADHFNLREEDFVFVGATDALADQAFLSRGADALFRIRALGNPAIQRLAGARAVRFLPITQAAAMKIRYPAFQPALIPAGAYFGEPPNPPADVPAIAIHRMLLARAGADEEAIREATAVLLEQRQEIAQEIPNEVSVVRLLVSQIRRFDPRSDFGPGLHRGAASYYDKDKPSFLRANADYIGLMLSVVVMLGSWIWQLKNWMTRQQKNVGDEYTSRVIQLMTDAQSAESPMALDALKMNLLATLTSAVHDLDADKISEASFQSFRDVLQIVLEVIRERREMLATRRNILSIDE